MLIKEAMKTPPRSIAPSNTVAEAARVMDKECIGSLPVVKDGKLVGILTDRDICCRAIGQGRDPQRTSVRTIMSRDVVTCFDDQDLHDAAAVMERRKVLRVPILDRTKRLVGIVTLADLSHRVGPELTAEVEGNVTWR